jgi:hypothetical protein
MTKDQPTVRTTSVRAFLIRIGVALVPVLLLCIPAVFRAVVNSLAYTANWVSFRVGWDWHRISPFFRPERDILHYPRPVTHWSVWLVLSVVALDVVALILAPWLIRHRQALIRETAQVLVGVNVALLCFLGLTLCLRIAMGHLH